tara:strand:+ start:292 stop:654 length:363 start_codon:yes stop_codon:yes gene_type:complete
MMMSLLEFVKDVKKIMKKGMNMADKTKMILRNDPAKNRKKACDNCGDEYFDTVDPRPISDDMFDFIIKQEHWARHETPSICWGMLCAVFKVIFDMAPTEKQAIQIITDCLSGFMEEGGNA